MTCSGGVPICSSENHESNAGTLLEQGFGTSLEIIFCLLSRWRTNPGDLRVVHFTMWWPGCDLRPVYVTAQLQQLRLQPIVAGEVPTALDDHNNSVLEAQWRADATLTACLRPPRSASNLQPQSRLPPPP